MTKKQFAIRAALFVAAVVITVAATRDPGVRRAMLAGEPALYAPALGTGLETVDESLLGGNVASGPSADHR